MHIIIRVSHGIVAVTVMVIACPHAPGLAVPLVVAVSTALAATNGLLIRDRAAFERARNVDAIVFDKTGTLTTGEFGVTDTLLFSKELDRDAVLQLAAAVGAGTDVAIETADIVLVRSNPLDVAAILSLSRATYRKMIQNLAWATGYNAFAIPLAAGVLYPVGVVLSPAAGAALMSLSTVIVAINARLLRVERNSDQAEPPASEGGL